MNRLPFCLLAPLMAALVLATGCESTPTASSTGSSTPQGRDDLLISYAHADELGFRLSWQRDLAKPANQRLAYMAVLGDLVALVEHPSNNLGVFQLADGNVRFARKIDNDRFRTFRPTRRGDTIFIHTESVIYGHNAQSGTRTSQANLSFTASTSGVLFGNSIVFGGVNGEVWAQNPASTSRHWQTSLVGSVMAEPLVTNAGVVLADIDGHMVSVGEQGQLLWRHSAFGGVVTDPVTSGPVVFLPSEDRGLYALNTISGQPAWLKYHASAALTQSPVISQGVLYLPVPGEGLVALDANNGHPLWTSPADGLPLGTVQDMLLVHGDRELALLDTDDGQPIVVVPTAQLQEVVLTEEGGLVLLSPGGQIAYLRAN